MSKIGIRHGVLSKKEIKDYELIKGLDDKCLEVCSYDLRLSDRHYTFDSEGKMTAVFLGTDGNKLDEANKDVHEEKLILHFSAGQPDILRIPPFGSAIIELKEIVDTYTVAKDHNRLIVGRFDLKLKSIYKGMISQQATQVEPCYYGRLYCFLHNFTAKEIIIYKDEKVATIEFLYAGGDIDEDTTKQIIDQTMRKNADKYTGKFVFDGRGIEDVRFLPNRGSIPAECGLAPIYRLVNNNVDAAVQRYMEKDSTVNSYADRISKQMNEHQGIVKLVLSLLVGAISLFGATFVADVQAQLQYFEQQLTFFGETIGGSQGTINPELLKVLQDHSRSFEAYRTNLFWFFFIAVVVFLLAIVFYYFVFSESFWVRKRNRLTGKDEYTDFKKYLQEKKKEEKREAKRRAEEERWAKRKANADGVEAQKEGANKKGSGKKKETKNKGKQNKVKN